MKKVSILFALLLAAGLAGCQQRDAQAPESEPSPGAQEPGTQPMEPGAEERTGYGEQQQDGMQELEQRGGEMMDDAQQRLDAPAEGETAPMNE
jgi:hypothetical protein